MTVDSGRSAPQSCGNAAADEGARADRALLQHNFPWAHDAYVRIALAGAGAPKQRIRREVATENIAATLALWLSTRHPSGLAGKPLLEVRSQ
ncbi:hypothetical protein WME90_21230 [Sorangium sp. So ce375]|uniref:hypothetical protein n=1 Tax=Sorangium sp. So ce375 TaxID=3133306 RepID=UPI003F5C1EED